MEEKERKTITLRLRALMAVVVLVFSILSFNLWRLQIANGSYYSEMARTNYTQTVPLPATRGEIIDSKGKLLVTSVPRLALTLDWLELQDAKGSEWKDVIQSLAVYLKGEWPNQNQSAELITEDILALIQNYQWERYRPITILTEVSDQLRATIAEHQEELPGVSVDALPVRSYPEKTMAGQILGYVREISDEEIDWFNKDPLAQKDGFKYSQGDLVGKMGVEKSYDYWLRGREGVQVAEVDNNNRPFDKKVLKPTEPGKTVQLTIDADLQKVVENALDEVITTKVQPDYPDVQQGAAVVIEVNTGKILAMASRPYMDPNDLIGIISDETADKYFTSEDAASFNRALSGLYPPGSTYKPITAMAALQARVTTPNEQVYDDISSLGSREAQIQGFGEWGGRNFGNVNLYRAIANSSNIYFQVMGRRVFDAQPELMRQISHEFGLGVTSGVDIPGEAKGIAPSEEWKKANYQPYYDKLRDQKLAAIESDYSVRISQAADDKSKKRLEQERDRKKKEVETWYKQMIWEKVDWHLYDSFNNSIGQGYNAYTPLQLVNYVATLVNGGKHMRPYVVDKIIDPVDESVVFENKPTVLNAVSVSPENLEIVKAAMREVTRGEGTANFMSIQLPEFTGGGKTGTAQIGSKDTVAGKLYNGMFVAFAPYDNPQIAFAGVVEYGGSGGTTAGLVAKAAFMQYFGWKSTNGG